MCQTCASKQKPKQASSMPMEDAVKHLQKVCDNLDYQWEVQTRKALEAVEATYDDKHKILSHGSGISYIIRNVLNRKTKCKK